MAAIVHGQSPAAPVKAPQMPALMEAMHGLQWKTRKSIVTSLEQAETCVSNTCVPGPCACVPPSLSHLVPAPRLSSYLYLFLSAPICILATPSSLILV